MPDCKDQLRYLACKSKCIGEITDFGNCAVSLGILVSDLHISHVGFTACQVGILQNVPWTDNNASIRDQLLKSLFLLGSHLQIIFDNNRLAIKEKLSSPSPSSQASCP